MDRYPIILQAGAAVFGKVGGEMMITDPWVHGLLNPPKWAEYASMVFFVVFVCVLSRFLLKRASAKCATRTAAAGGEFVVDGPEAA